MTLTILRASVIVQSADREAALDRYKRLLGVDPVMELAIPRSELVVTAFPGLSMISGPPEALAPVRELRATMFVDSLNETLDLIAATGWKRAGSLGSGLSVLAQDLDGNLIELVQEPVKRSAEPLEG